MTLVSSNVHDRAFDLDEQLARPTVETYQIRAFAPCVSCTFVAGRRPISKIIQTGHRHDALWEI
jgi:hypothetical protein